MLVDFSGKQLATWNDWATILQVNCPFPVSTLLFQWTRSKKVSSSRWRLEFVGGLFFIQLPSKLLLTHVRVVGGFLKWGYLQIIHSNRIFHYKPSILGIPNFWKPPVPRIRGQGTCHGLHQPPGQLRWSRDCQDRLGPRSMYRNPCCPKENIHVQYRIQSAASADTCRWDTVYDIGIHSIWYRIRTHTHIYTYILYMHINTHTYMITM